MHAHRYWFGFLEEGTIGGAQLFASRRPNFAVRPFPRESGLTLINVCRGFRAYWSIARQWCLSLNRLYDLYGHARETGRPVRPHGSRQPISKMRAGVMYLLQECRPPSEIIETDDNVAVEVDSATCSSAPSPEPDRHMDPDDTTPQPQKDRLAVPHSLTHRRRHDLFGQIAPRPAPVRDLRFPNRSRPSCRPLRITITTLTKSAADLAASLLAVDYANPQLAGYNLASCPILSLTRGRQCRMISVCVVWRLVGFGLWCWSVASKRFSALRNV